MCDRVYSETKPWACNWGDASDGLSANPMGWGAAELKYRFQWNAPIRISPEQTLDDSKNGRVIVFFFHTASPGLSS